MDIIKITGQDYMSPRLLQEANNLLTKTFNIIFCKSMNNDNVLRLTNGNLQILYLNALVSEAVTAQGFCMAFMPTHAMLYSLK